MRAGPGADIKDSLQDGPETVGDPDFVTLPLLTISDAAAYLGVGRKVIYQLIEMGEIRTVRVRRAAMVERRSLDDFRASGKLT
jgi:excisionase family DNA binding protein